MATDVLVIVLVSSLVYLSNGEQCITDPHNPCKATCMRGSLDISNLFKYPVNVSGGSFRWDPCKGMECRGQKDVAVCQKADLYYNCGNYTQPIYILESYDPYQFTVEYQNGEYWRISVFRFMEETIQPNTTVTYLTETPALQYNFLVAGKCVGQPFCNEKPP